MQAAPPFARLLQRLRSWGLLRPDARRVINLSIAVLSALVLVLAVRPAWRSLREYQQARQVAHVDAATNDFIAAAGLLELERTYGSALLGGESLDPQRLEQLRYDRRQSDRIWRRALGEARAIAARFPTDDDLFARLATAETSYRALSATRGQLESCLRIRPCGLGEAAWQQAVSNVIADSAAAREAVYFSIDTPERPARLYGAVQRSVWTLNEQTRRERGLMAFYLSAKEAPPAAARAELDRERAVGRDAEDSLRVFAQLHRLDPRVRLVIDEADRSLGGRFAPLLAAVLDGQRQLDGQAWLTGTAPTIAALDRLSGTVDAVVAARAADAMRAGRNEMLLYGVLVLLASAAAVLSTTKVRQTANALFHQKELAEVTIRSIGDAVITTDRLGRVEYINPAAEQMTGWRNAEARGLPLERVFEVVNGLTLEPQTNPIATCLRDNRVVSLDNNTVLVRRDGVRRYIEDSAAPIRDPAGHLVGGVLVFYDATQAHQAEHLISYRATHDALTELINRREFEHRLAALLAPGRDDSSRHALLFLDLDQFTVVNESCGHLAGDHLLREVSRILRECSRSGDLLARLGGDEFGLIVRNCTLDEARALAESMRAAVSSYRFEWQGLHFQAHLSVGLVPFGLDAGAPAALMSRVEVACHLAKEKGRDRVQIYDERDGDIGLRTGALHWMARLNEALVHDRLTLYCQPVVPLGSGGGRHGEILARMLDTDGQLIPASQFIPHAERYGLMPRVDRWVVRKALAMLAPLYAAGRGEEIGVLAINLSGASLSDPSMAQFIADEVRACGVPPRGLCFEITETAAVSSLRDASAFITSLRRIGCAFALDDFGRGMSSFMYLKQLPVDYLKIDGEFVRRIADDPVSRAMVKAIHALGQAIGIATIAECVETASVHRELEALGIGYAQGLEMGAPLPLSSYLQLADGG